MTLIYIFYLRLSAFISVQFKMFVFVCPVCGGSLVEEAADLLVCAGDGLTFACEDGIWRFLPPARQTALAQFRQEYETVRRAEGRGSDDPAYYRALPFVAEDSDGRSHGWSIRAQSYQTLLDEIVMPLEGARKRPLTVLDLGAGNGWLSNRLAQRGHQVAAVDLAVNAWDGLGAHRHYDAPFTPIQAEFDRLPLAPDQIDLAVFNASFHYSVGYQGTLESIKPVLRSRGMVVVMDTAVYRQDKSGRQMVQAREAAFRQKYGFPANALPSENYLTFNRLVQLSAQTGIHWQIVWPLPRWRRLFRRFKVALRRQREPAQFPLLVGQF